MGLQLIFVVETNKTCQSDWIYIKDTIGRFYSYDNAQVKLSPIFMDGKGNYYKKEKEVLKQITQYENASDQNTSKVFYCFDCDDYDIDRDDINFLDVVTTFCDARGYNMIWFCRDVERVFLGRKVPNRQKQIEAAKFKAKRMINSVNQNILTAKIYGENRSNILNVIDETIREYSTEHICCPITRST